MDIRDAITVVNDMLQRDDGKYFDFEKTAIIRLLSIGEKRISYYEPRPLWGRNKETTCAICGKTFIARKIGVKYCGQTCRNKASWERIKNDSEKLKRHKEYNNNYKKKFKINC